MVAHMAATAKPSVGLLCGFLEGLQKRDSMLTDTLLDEALYDTTLAESFPVLQASVVIDEKGLDRLLRALELGTAPIWRFRFLAFRPHVRYHPWSGLQAARDRDRQ